MRKLKRRKVIKEFIEDRIAKNQRRIARLAEENFNYRKQLEVLNALPVQKPLTKADRETLEKENAETGENPVDLATAEAMKDSADQEIGMSAPGEEQTSAIS
jgi:hypothetical protein